MAEALTVLASRYRAPVLTGEGTWRPTLAMIFGADALPAEFRPR